MYSHDNIICGITSVAFSKSGQYRNIEDSYFYLITQKKIYLVFLSLNNFLYETLKFLKITKKFQPLKDLSWFERGGFWPNIF